VDGEDRAVVKKLYDTRPRHLIDLENRERIVERKLSLGDEIIHGH